jgi:DNA-binding IclR family transcriptional regulator
VLQQVRRAGYASEDGSVTPEFASVAAAVLDHGGHPVAAVALTFPAADADTGVRQTLAATVTRTAAELSRRIGGSSPGRWRGTVPRSAQQHSSNRVG